MTTFKLFALSLFTAVLLTACGDGSGGSSGSGGDTAVYELTISGPDSVERGAVVTLSAQITRDGVATEPDDGYTWSQVDGEEVGLTVGEASDEVFFYVPDSGDSVTVRAEAVADGRNLSGTFEVAITDVAPSAGVPESLEIQGPVRVGIGHQVRLNAVYTRNAEISDAAVTWQQDDGPAVGTSTDGMALEFTAPDISIDTPLLFSATVEQPDGILLVTFYEVTVTVGEIGFGNQVNPDGQQLPQSGLGQANLTQRPVLPGATVLLTSQGLLTGGGTGVTYQWQQTGGTPVQLINPNSANTSFVAPQQAGGAGQKLTFVVTATGPGGQSATQTQVVNVARPSNFVPSQAGAQHQVYNGHGPITLTAGTLGGAQPLSYAWYEGTTVTGGKPITGATGGSYTVTPPSVNQNTTFNYVVRVTDANGHTLDIRHSIDVVSGGQGGGQPPANSQPLAVTFPSQAPLTVIEGDRIAPVAAASGGSGNYAYQWSVDTGKVGVISGQNSATPIFELLGTGGASQKVYLTVRVTDGTTDANGSPTQVTQSIALTVLPVFRIDNHQNQAGSAGGTGPGSSTNTPAVVESGKAFHPSVGVQQTGKAGGSFSYQWTIASPDPLPPGLTVNIAGANTQNPVVVASGASGNTQIRLKAVVTYTAPNGKIYTQTTGSSFTSAPATTPLRPGMTISLPGHADVHPGRTVHPSVSVANPVGTPRYQWAQVSGPAVTLVSVDKASTEFVAPKVSGHSDIVLEVTVSDASGNPPRVGRVTYSVDPLVPPSLAMTVVPSAGGNVYENQLVKPTAKVLHAECGSSGAGCPAYQWSVTRQANTTISLSNADTAAPSFVVPAGGGVLELEVAVTDDRGTERGSVRYQFVDSIEVTTKAPASGVAEGASVQLLASVINNSGQVSYQWTAINNGKLVKLKDDDTRQVTVVAQGVDKDSVVTLRVTAKDASNNEASADVSLTIKNRLFSVDVGADQVVPLGQSTSLHAVASGGLPPFSYSWSPAGLLNATTGDSVSSKPLSQAGAGLPVFVTVTDAIGNQATDNLVLTFGGQGQQLAIAGGKSVAIAGLEAVMSAQVLNADPAATLVWVWKQLTGPTVALSDASSSAPRFTAPNNKGELTFETTLTENGGAARSATRVFTVDVIDPPALAVATTPTLYGLKGGTLSLTAQVTLADGSAAAPVDVKRIEWKEGNPACGHVINNGSATGQTDLTATVTLSGSVGTCIFEVIATEPNDQTVKQQVTVQVTEPVVLAPDQGSQNVKAGSPVQLTVPVAAGRQVTWTQTGGTSVTINNGNTAQANFKAPEAPNGDLTLTFEAKIKDPDETVTVTVLVHKPQLSLTFSPLQATLDPGGKVVFSLTVLDKDTGLAADPTDYTVFWKLTNLQPYSSFIQAKPIVSPSNVLELTRDADNTKGFPGPTTVTIPVRVSSTTAGQYVGATDVVSVVVSPKAVTTSTGTGTTITGAPSQAPSAAAFLSALLAVNTDLNSGVFPAGSEQTLHGALPRPFKGTYEWKNGPFLNPNTGDNPKAPFKPVAACARNTGIIEVTATLTEPPTLKGKTVTTTLEYKSAREGKPPSCVLCRGPKFICERAHAVKQCGKPEQQYCVNDVENLTDGSRYVTRRCATKNEVETFLNKGENALDRCKKYNVKELSDTHFSCSYACKGENCNLETVPSINRVNDESDLVATPTDPCPPETP